MHSFIDKKMPLSLIDTIFVNTNYELEDHNDQNPNRELCRYEFYEILLRIAKAKYKDQGVCSNLSESLELLIKDLVIPNSHPGKWQEFRDRKLWTIEVNDIFFVNLSQLRRIYNNITFEDAIRLMTKRLKTGLSESQAVYCYGMSKMTIMNEMGKTQTKTNTYWRLQFVEFLEYIGR